MICSNLPAFINILAQNLVWSGSLSSLRLVLLMLLAKTKKHSVTQEIFCIHSRLERPSRHIALVAIVLARPLFRCPTSPA
eukprot:5674887-Amphidinium_carterae.1